jgi:hypothetical protein
MNADTIREPGAAGRRLHPCELEAHVLARVGGQLTHLEIVLCDDGLILRGRAKTYYAKQLAQHAVMEATNLPIRANEIVVC